MASKLTSYLIKYKTKKIKPGERIIKAKNAADAISRLKHDVEGLVKIEEPKLASQRDLDLRQTKSDKETLTQNRPKIKRTLGKPDTAKRSKEERKPEIASPLSASNRGSQMNASKQYDLDSIDLMIMRESLKSIFKEIISE